MKNVTVSITVKVTVDESKFDEKFMEEFRESFYHFYDLDDHYKHLAQLYARGLADNGDFIEGYGYTKDMGIEFEELWNEEEINVI